MASDGNNGGQTENTPSNKQTTPTRWWHGDRRYNIHLTGVPRDKERAGLGKHLKK